MVRRSICSLLSALLAVLAACSDSKPEPGPPAVTTPSTDGTTDSGTPDVSDPYVDAVHSACTGGEDGTVAMLDATKIESTVTWSLDFDAGAEAAGWEDCSYTRVYSGIQRVDIEHICPHCTVIAEGDATMIEGFTDCYEPLFGGDQTRTETWGVAGTDIFRRGASQLPLSEDPLATLTESSGDGTAVPISWESEYGVNDDAGDEVGRFILAASGAIAWSEDSTIQLEEPFGPRAAAYACGWECNDPGDLTGAYPLTPGGVLPNFRMRDQCGDMLDIHDLYGSYIVIDSAQSDCGPCLQMADEAEAFKATMTEAGIPIRLVPVLGNGLSEVYLTPSEATQAEWVERFEPEDPVLADRGWGYAALGRYLSDHEGTDIAWPAWIVIGPDMTVITGAVGFGSWDTIGSIIESDWEARSQTGPL